VGAHALGLIRIGVGHAGRGLAAARARDGGAAIAADEAAKGRAKRLWDMESNLTGSTTALGAAQGSPGRPGAATVEGAVTRLYEAHALGMIRLAHIMLGDRQSAEDAVQEAFCGLYRRWSHLADQASAVHYVRSAVLNHCRSVLRRRATSQAPQALTSHPEMARSAESAVLTREERDEIMRAVRRLPPRQREALVLRFYLDLSAEETATTMGISPSSVRSATHRALESLSGMLQEQS
jgi:RNA polymerase sigma-70 factor (sigma-E family)